jgi:hypothetical protein
VPAFRAILRSPAFIVLFVLCCGVILHECGHAIAGVLCGGVVSDFTLFSIRPQVRISGRFTPEQEIFKAVAGSGSILLAWAFFTVVGPVRARVAQDALSCLALVELGGWTLSALTCSARMMNNDAVRFLEASGADRGIVVAGCTALACAGALIRWSIPRPD